VTYFDFHHPLKVDEMIWADHHPGVLLIELRLVSIVVGPLYEDGYLVFVQLHQRPRLRIGVKGVLPRVVLPPIVIKLKLGC